MKRHSMQQGRLWTKSVAGTEEDRDVTETQTFYFLDPRDLCLTHTESLSRVDQLSGDPGRSWVLEHGILSASSRAIRGSLASPWMGREYFLSACG